MVTENFLASNGMPCKRITHEPKSKWILSADLGASNDPTALTVLHYHRDALDTFTSRRNPRYDRNRQGVAFVTEQDTTEHYDVRHLERLALGTDYTAVANYLRDMMQRDPLRREDADLVVDESSIGRPVCDDLCNRLGLHPIRVVITAGSDQTKIEGARRWNVAKSLLVSGLDAVLHNGQLRFADHLSEEGAMKEELLNFTRSVSAAGRTTWAARASAHDDLVMAVAMAVWRARGHGGGEVFAGTVRGMV